MKKRVVKAAMGWGEDWTSLYLSSHLFLTSGQTRPFKNSRRKLYEWLPQGLWDLNLSSGKCPNSQRFNQLPFQPGPHQIILSESLVSLDPSTGNHDDICRYGHCFPSAIVSCWVHAMQPPPVC